MNITIQNIADKEQEILEQLVSGAQPYIFELLTRFGDYEENTRIVAVTNEPQDMAEQLAMDERGCGPDDYDETMGGYWFDGYMVFSQGFSVITPFEMAVFLVAEDIR
jgi:hypothetical protein